MVKISSSGTVLLSLRRSSNRQLDLVQACPDRLKDDPDRLKVDLFFLLRFSYSLISSFCAEMAINERLIKTGLINIP